jgi:spore coat polysaccharide biosynthesis protein SpsF
MFKIIIQCRLSSTRLKRKILKKIYKDQTIIEFMIERLLVLFKPEDIIIATTIKEEDHEIIELLKKYKVKFFRGSEKNVLKRYYFAAKKYKVEHIIRVTSDCPLIDPYLIRQMWHYYKSIKIDYLANTLPRDKSQYPDGSDIEIFSFNSLNKLFKSNLTSDDREHVTNSFWKKKIYKSKIFKNNIDYSSYRYSIDYFSDLKGVRKIIPILKKQKKYGSAKNIVSIINKLKLKKVFEINHRKHLKNRKDLI